jgi:predicted dehydrogenase
MEPKDSGMSRRDFAKLSTAGLAFWTSTSAFAAKKKDRVKVGLIGCGGRGTGAAINHLQGNENSRIVALADVFEDKVHGTKKALESHSDSRVRNGCAVKNKMLFTGLDAINKILETDIDILIEGTLPYSRCNHIDAAINAGKHLFTEKPVASDPVGIRKVIAASQKAKEKGLSIVAGTQRRHQKPYIETIKKIQDGAIGDIVAGRIMWVGGIPFVRERDPKWGELEFRIRNWISNCFTSGDNIVEQHVHNIDVMCWVMGGPPESVLATGGRAWQPAEEKYGDIWGNFAADFEFKNGVHVSSMSRWWDSSLKPDGEVSELFLGTKGKSNCHDMGAEGIDPYVQEHIDLVNSVLGTGPHYNEGEQVAHSTMTAIMARESAYTGKKITWEQIMASDLSITPKELALDKPCPLPPVPVGGHPRKSI